MGDPLHLLSDGDLRALAGELAGGRLAAPYSAFALGRVVAPPLAARVGDRLGELAASGMAPRHLAVLAEAILAARADRPTVDDAVELVWTGPEAAGTANRDTGVVVRELFSRAAGEVLVAGFAVFQGQELFRCLADRMTARPGLRVRLYLDVHRGPADAGAAAAEVVARFADRFARYDWPAGRPLPEVYYDPRSLGPDPAARAVLHAKCVVVDRREALVTSANFTPAAHDRNIEAGVVVRSERLSGRLADHFDALARLGLLRPVFGHTAGQQREG